MATVVKTTVRCARSKVGCLPRMDVRRPVGLNVKRFRAERGLLQEERAFECGLHRTYLSGVARGVRNPTS